LAAGCGESWAWLSRVSGSSVARPAVVSRLGRSGGQAGGVADPARVAAAQSRDPAKAVELFWAKPEGDGPFPFGFVGIKQLIPASGDPQIW
jgi:hypothetical protein